MTYYLYYAGMAQNTVTEQIGLAKSEDGYSFTRVDDGLIIPVDPSQPWKALRTCNPTVLQEDNRFLMLYQGISEEKITSIAVATSLDGINWNCIDTPALTIKSEADTLQTEHYGTTDLIEPAVIKKDGQYRMWFISRGTNEPGNRLNHATSSDGLSWNVDRANLVTGFSFGEGCKIHYPQVILDSSGYWFYISLRQPNGQFSVRRAHSKDGYTIGEWEVLPPTGTSPSLLLRILNKLRLCGWRNSHGLAHSHITERDKVDRIYFHAYHLDRQRQTYLDVVAVEASNPRIIHRALNRATDHSAWDSYFVGDPYIILLH